MSFAQAMKHWGNHRKDRFRQQCGFHFNGTGIKSGAALVEETAEGYYVADYETREKLSEMFIEYNDSVDAYEEIEKQRPNTRLCILSDKGLLVAE